MAKLHPDLASALGESIAGLDKLPAKAQQQLAEDLTQAHHQHDKVLKQSMDNALEHIPRLLRGTVKKILGL